MKNQQIVGIIIGLLVFADFPLKAEQQVPPTPSGKEAPAESSTVDERAEGSRPLVELLQDLKSKDVTIRRKAAFGLSWKSPLCELMAIPPLIEALSDENADVRKEIARVIGKYGPQAKSAVPALLKIVKKKEDEARFAAIAAIGQIGAEAKEAVPSLVEILAENNYIAREAAAKALGGVGREARPVISNLRKALTDYAPPVRVAAANALWRISGSAKDSVPVLIDVLQDTHLLDQFDLIGIEIGRDLNIPISQRLSKQNSSRRNLLPPFLGGSRAEAAQALGEISRDARTAIPVLQRIAKEDSGWVQFRAASALLSIAPEAVEIVPALRASLHEEDEILRFQAVICLGRLNGKARADRLPLLIEALNDQSGLVQSGAMIALRKLGPAAKNAVPSLIRILQNDESLIHVTASTLEAIGPEAKGIVPQLTALLKDENAEKRRVAANILATIGHEAAAAIPMLVKTLRDPDGKVRMSAANALQRIDPSSMPKK